MKITVLGSGTSQGIPLIGCSCSVCRSLDFRDKRLRTSILIQTPKNQLVIDAGPDFRQQMLRHRVSHLDALLLTHEHKDHVAGLDDIRAFNFLSRKAMPVFGQERVLNHLKVEFAYAFAEKKYPGVPQLNLHTTEDAEPFEINEEKIIPIPVMHAKLPVLGYRFGPFTYITDANFIPESSLKMIEGSQVLILNALQKEPHISHFTLEEAISLVQKLNIPKVYFTHISHKMGLHADVSKELPNGIELAWDGLEINF